MNTQAWATQCINCGHIDQPAETCCSACHCFELHAFPVTVVDDQDDEPTARLAIAHTFG